MDLITPDEVIRRIELYFRGNALKFLSKHQQKAADFGIVATSKNSFDGQSLNVHNAGLACERYIESIPAYPHCYEGRGIVICGGGQKYFTNAWVSINMLRHLGCKLPIQLWHLGRKEMGEQMKNLLMPLGVECVDAYKTRKNFPARILQGWSLKPYAIVQSPFREVLFLDADNMPVTNPEFLFESPEFKNTGAIFWPDYNYDNFKKARPAWRSCGLRQPHEAEFESGQIVLDKQRCWAALRLSLWFNENADFYYQYLHGDKETFHMAFRKLRKTYSLIQKPIHTLVGTMCQHDFQGRRIFQHRNTAKWEFSGPNKRIKDFWLEKECRKFLTNLHSIWDGRIG
jgi:hypothetical protein